MHDTRVSLLKKAKENVIKRFLFLTSFFSTASDLKLRNGRRISHMCCHSFTNLGRQGDELEKLAEETNKWVRV